MKKEFKVTGACNPRKHYMADISGKLAQVMRMVERGDYFVINRPRQFGKTTLLALIGEALNKSGDYISFSLSFERHGRETFSNERVFCAMFLGEMEATFRLRKEPVLADQVQEELPRVMTMGALSKLITQIAKESSRKIVLLIDEVDKSSNYDLFIDFLGMLRSKYLDQDLDLDHSFHSVLLAGVHDIKNLKYKISPDAGQRLNSPWNIAAEFRVDMSLQPVEIIPMLEDYAHENGVQLDAPALAERLFYYTSGYPFLVSKICKMVDEDILPGKANPQAWEMNDLEMAVRALTEYQSLNVNFETLFKNLENHPDLMALVQEIVIEGRSIPFNPFDPLTNLGILHGIFLEKPGNGIHIHNRIYRELIYKYLTAKALNRPQKTSTFHEDANYSLPGGRELDMPKVLTKFQEFMHQNYSEKDADFVERQGRLIFLAFLKPILNGKGYDFKEPQISSERRLDILVTFFEHRYLLELKIWRGPEYHKEGLAQLAAYMDDQQMNMAYLLIFDRRRKPNRSKPEWLEVEGKRVLAVWA